MKKMLIYSSALVMNVFLIHKEIFFVLIMLNIVDYITGILGDLTNGGHFSILKSVRGIGRKLNVLMYVLTALCIDIMIKYQFGVDKYTFISGAVITWLALAEALSIVKNVERNGKCPPVLKDFLRKVVGYDGK